MIGSLWEADQGMMISCPLCVDDFQPTTSRRGAVFLFKRKLLMKNGLDEEGRRKCKLRINITISFSHFRLVLLWYTTMYQQHTWPNHLNFLTFLPLVFTRRPSYKFFQVCRRQFLFLIWCKIPSKVFQNRFQVAKFTIDSQYRANSHWPHESQNRKPKELNKRKLASNFDRQYNDPYTRISRMHLYNSFRLIWPWLLTIAINWSWQYYTAWSTMLYWYKYWCKYWYNIILIV